MSRHIWLPYHETNACANKSCKVQIAMQVLCKDICYKRGLWISQKAEKFIKVPYYVTYVVMIHQPYTDLKATRNCVAKEIRHLQVFHMWQNH